MSDRIRFSRKDALAVVRELLPILEPVAAQFVIAGSLRRRKQEVGDIEILFIPRIAPQPDPGNLFGENRPTDLFSGKLEELLSIGILEKRLSKLERPTWGHDIRLATHKASGIPVDFFTATPANWFNVLVCRTGSAETNTAIATRALAMGWKWHPNGPGFERRRIFGNPLEERTVRSEQEVFNFVGIPYREPWER